MSVAEWNQEVKQPLLSFLKNLNMLMSKIKHLKQSSAYNSKTTNRQCFMQARWQYIHENLSPIAQKNMSVLVRIGDYREEGGQKIYWGFNWWGNSKDVMTVFRLFEKFKRASHRLFPERCNRGASVQGILLLPKTYTAEQVVGLLRDIKEEIVEDLEKLTVELTNVLEAAE
jgi:hypothetical protein